MRMFRTFLPALVALAASAAVLAACGSSSTPASTGTSGGSGGSGGGSSSTTAASPGSTSAGAAGMPAVANATDLKKEPMPSAGSPPPPTSLTKADLVVGTGQAAAATNTVQIQYVGANYADGKIFDASWSRGQAATFPLNQVIPGFAQGIVGMKIGGRRELVIPPSLGYGASGSPPAVGPNETLVFVIDLLGVS